LSRLALSAPLEEQDRALLPTLAELGLGRQVAAGFELDAFGNKCADAAREHVLWVERGRRLHWENELPAIALANFKDKRVLEIGPGWGCNLFRLLQVTPHVRGLEIEDVYRRFTVIFANLEGIDPPVIDRGDAEQLPYEDGSFDWILMFSAMQYMDVKAAVSEVARVLAPGGRLLASQPILATLLKDMMRSPRHKAMTLANSLSYGLIGRRLRGVVPGNSTSRPVYLTRRRIVGIAEDAGLRWLPGLSIQLDRDFVLVAEKPVGNET
jgi:SAM-dependent methyltransferase